MILEIIVKINWGDNGRGYWQGLDDCQIKFCSGQIICLQNKKAGLF
jgi:hypothetical protein